MSRIIVAGTSSHCGKTTIACGLLASLRKRGLKVCAYKTGPDYIDPQYLRSAGGCEAYNLDNWLMSSENVRELFAKTSRGHDIAVIEGAMGLYDGGTNSTAEIAKLLGAPVVLVVDAKSAGESVAAAALGFREYDREIDFAGVILNNIGSDYHGRIIADALREKGIKCFGALRRNDGLAVPKRHLGLALEHRGENLERLRAAVDEGIDVDALLSIAASTPPLTGRDFPPRLSKDRGQGVRLPLIGIAMDEAFSFTYPESLAVLEELGAELVYFSPLNDDALPDADGYIFCGGYPEMFAETLSCNAPMLASVRRNTRPVLAECGGMMYLCRELTDTDGRSWPMAGVIPLRAEMTGRAVLGYMEARALRDNILCVEGTVIRGHEFHYSRVEFPPETCAFSLTRRNTNTSHAGGYAKDNILASYLHVNFFGNAGLAERFLDSLTLSSV